MIQKKDCRQLIKQSMTRPITMITLRSILLYDLIFSACASSAVDLLTSFNFASYNRQLEVGDFAIVNEVFKDSEFKIDVPDPIIVGSFLGDTTVDINNLVCRKINIGDITLAYVQPLETSVTFTMNVIQLDIQCSFDYSYDAPLGIGGSASATLTTDDSSFSVDIIMSQPESGQPPNALVISNCAAS